MRKLARELVDRMHSLTSVRHSEMAVENAELNLPFLKNTVADLPPNEKGSSAIVVSGGPSLHTRNSVDQIIKSDYRGNIICVDGALGHCLRSGLVPDYVLTVDPMRTRVVRWFGDPDFANREDDDYFQRQEMDPYLTIQEETRNNETIKLVNKFGPQIKIILSSSASQAVSQRCIESGMDIYWWNPIYDDFSDPNSITRKVYRMNHAPCMVTGGNVGTASWVFGHAILKLKQIAMVGMDFSYTPGTPKWNTQYGKEITELFGDVSEDAFIELKNPYLKETWFTDPAYYWYRKSFLSMVQTAGCETFNCTEGGLLFGKGIKFRPLQKFLTANGGSWA